MDLGYVTHAIHANSRLVYLVVSQSSNDRETLTITGPPNGNVYPPGPGWLYIVVDGVPSKGVKVMVGDGKGPVVDNTALEKSVQYFLRPDVSILNSRHSLLAQTAVDQYETSKKDAKDDGSE